MYAPIHYHQIDPLLLDIYYDEPVSDAMKARIKERLPSQVPYKGEGLIAVDDVAAAEKLLKEHVGEFEWEYYSGIIRSEKAKDATDGIPMGKFEIEDLKGFLVKLMDSGVRLHACFFYKEPDW